MRARRVAMSCSDWILSYLGRDSPRLSARIQTVELGVTRTGLRVQRLASLAKQVGNRGRTPSKSRRARLWDSGSYLSVSHKSNGRWLYHHDTYARTGRYRRRLPPRLRRSTGTNTHAPILPKRASNHSVRKRMARPEGLEPSTPGLEGRCSIQLSYGRVSVGYFEPRRVVNFGSAPGDQRVEPSCRGSRDRAVVD